MTAAAATPGPSPPDPIMAETIQLRAELSACRRQVTARDGQLERAYAHLVTVRAQLAAQSRDLELLADVTGAALLALEGPAR